MDTCPIIIMPKKGPNTKTIQLIRKVLRGHPDGLWIREIARISGIPKSTVHLYITAYMKSEVKEVLRGKGSFIVIVKLK